MKTPNAQKPFKPLLAPPKLEKPENLVFPMLASPKYDGIRTIMRDGVPVSRKLLPIPNAHIRSYLTANVPAGLQFDGELLIRDANFHDSSSGIMGHEGVPDFIYHVFDVVDITKPFEERYKIMRELVRELNDPRIVYVEHILVESWEDVIAYEERCIALGFEGAMLRSLQGRYKYGRATEKEQILLKVKQFERDEAVIKSCRELMQNNNEATTDNLGHTKRSSHASGKVGLNTLGALVCDYKGLELSIGSGFTRELRDDLWKRRDMLPGKLVTFKHQPSGAKDLPRFPVFIGIRDPADL